MLLRKFKPAFVPSRMGLWLLIAFLMVLWGAGGASRADASGQILVRAVAWLVLATWALSGHPIQFRSHRWLWCILAGTALCIAVQLVPLPPSFWMALPGHHLLAEGAEIAGQPQPWRPISISPSTTLNALLSMVVPLAVLVLAVHLGRSQQHRLASVLLALAMVGGLMALAQFSGAQVSSPFVNYVNGAASGTFANRNHFALFMATGIVTAFLWMFASKSTLTWRSLAGLCAILFSVLMILATGSRTGMVLAVLAIALGTYMSRRPIREQLRRLPRQYAVAAVVAAGLTVAAVVAVAILFDRADAVTRAGEVDNADDLRFLAMPTIVEMIGRYLPLGSGYGTFDAAYRISEETALLGRRYFNHAHNDFLEIVLQGGVIGVALLVAGISWWGWRSWQCWRGGTDETAMLRRAGSAIILLVLVASVTDYPARTPMIMGLLVIAAVWLDFPANNREREVGDASAGS